MSSIYDFSYQQLEDLLVVNGFKKYNAKQIFSWLYRKRVDSFDQMTDLSSKLRQYLNDNYQIGALQR